jgi:hypothetical protein
MNKDQGPLIEGESEARILGAEEDRIKRPGFFKNLIPFLITVPILYLVLHDQDWEEIKQAVLDCNLWLFIAGVLVYGLGYCITDYIFNWVMWNRVLVRISLYEVTKVRAAAMLPQLIVAPLSGIMTLIYMVRKKHVRVLPMLSVTPLLMSCDFWLMIIQMLIAFIIMPDLPAPVYYIFAAMLLGMTFIAWYFPGKGGRIIPEYIPWQGPKIFMDWFYNNQINYALRVAGPRDYAVLLPVRAAWPVFQVLGHYLALRAFGIEAPLSVVIVVVIFITLLTFLPVNILGLGAPNAVALFFAAYAASQEVVNAYSLLFQSSFSLLRLVVGTAFVYPFWRDAVRDHRAELSHVEREQEKSISSL